MAILACGHCGNLREVLIKKEYIDKKVKCPSCQKVILVHDTVAFITELRQENARLNQELGKLKPSPPLPSDKATITALRQENARLNEELVKLKQQPPLPSDKTTIAELRKENTRLVTLITELSKETSGLKEELVKLKQPPPLPSDKATIMALRQENARLNEELVKLKQRIPLTSDQRTQQHKGYAFVNLPSSPLLKNFKDVVQWFKTKQIEAKPDEKAEELIKSKQPPSLTNDKTIVELRQENARLNEKLVKLKQQPPLPGDKTTIAELRKENTRLVTLITELSKETSGLKEELIKLKQRVPLTSDQRTQQQKGYAFANLPSSPLLENFKDVVQWFKAKQIEAKPDEKAMDISGFFDEIAVQLGDNGDILGEVCHKIQRTQAKGYTNLLLNLSSHSQKEIQVIKRFCQEAYEKAFLTGYYTIDKDKKRVKLHLQTDKAIVKFFNGDWLEWFVFMKVATLLVDKQVKFACLRNFEIVFSNQDKQELDLFFLLKGSTLWGTTTAVWIECKSGEFRNSVEKYTKLRNRLQIDKRHSLLLALGISAENAAGLTSMFDITVVNEKNFLAYITGLL